MPDSALYSILNSAWYGSEAEKAAALVTATAYLKFLSPLAASRQLPYRDVSGCGVLHMIPLEFWECELSSSFLSLVIE